MNDARYDRAIVVPLSTRLRGVPPHVLLPASVSGQDVIARVLALARTRPLNAALLEVTGHDAAELESDWRRWYDLKPLSPPG